MRLMRVVGLVIMLVQGGGMALAAPLLKAGDRLVFLGDSITEQRIYTRYVMDYFALRYPGVAISFRNAGWGGDYAAGGLARLSRDVLSVKPTAVSICYGMNDGGYRAFDQGYYDRSMAAMSGLVSELKKAGVMVVLLTPGCVDTDRNPALKGDKWTYNETLDKFGKGIKELAAKEHLPFFDLHSLMLDVQTKAKTDSPHYTMIPDAVHPQPPGHAVMAYGLLKALGCDAPASSLVIDAAKPAATPDRCRVMDLKVTNSVVSFTRTDEALPTYFDPEVSAVTNYFPLHEDLNQYRFQVTGLKAGNWKLTVEGLEVGTFTNTVLAAGVNLGPLPGPWQDLGKKVNGLATAQENEYYVRWRQIAVVTVPKEAQNEQRALLYKLDSLLDDHEKERQQEAVGHPWKWVLGPAK